jgi:hypothetical protein
MGAAWATSHPATVALAALLLVAIAGCGARTESDPPLPTVAASPPETLPPLAHPPLDPPLEVTATFGEYRRGHFHAGLDFSTDLRVGRDVYAPLDGWVERVRASGAGYGRSLMLRSEDGRSVLFGHLDSFEEPIASWLAAVQDSSGQYEQDLAPAARRFPVRAGQRVAWSGESGAGPPHLHMEVRWGDMAYNPLRFGLTLPDVNPPELRRVTLEPIEPDSYVERSAAPRTFGLAALAETVVVEGAVRVWLEAADGVSDAWARVAPYAAALEWEGATVECRFDRVMWDDDMTAVEWVYDGSGRAAPGRAIGLWAAPEYRPTVLDAAAGAGVLRVAPGAPPRVLKLSARDAAGNATERALVVRGPRPGESGPGTSLPIRRRRAAAHGFEIAPLSGTYVRLAYAGAPPGTRDLRLGFGGTTRPASFDGRRWAAVVAVPEGVSDLNARAEASGWEERRQLHVVALGRGDSVVLGPALPGAPTLTGGAPGFQWSMSPGGVFAPTFVVVDSFAPASAAPGLEPLGPALRVGPALQPLRRAATVVVPVPEDSRLRARAGICYQRDRRWTWAESEVRDGGRAIAARIRALGRYALYADVAAPSIGMARALRRLRGAPHGRWSLQCAILERGSGLDPERTGFSVDGRRVPSEWEVERAVLRWRPLAPPAAGSHRYEVVATDRAGNETRRGGTFVVR